MRNNDMIKYIAKVSLMGGITLFLWGMLSWSILPWHTQTTHQFINETQVTEILKANTHQKGVYLIPYNTQSKADGITTAFINIVPSTSITDMGMGKKMVMGFASQLVVMMIAALFLYKSYDLNYLCHIGYLGLLGFLIGFGSYIQSWIWVGFETKYTIAMILDYTIGWGIAGAIIGRFSPAPHRILAEEPLLND